jgi:hypothetical protein
MRVYREGPMSVSVCLDPAQHSKVEFAQRKGKISSKTTYLQQVHWVHHRVFLNHIVSTVQLSTTSSLFQYTYRYPCKSTGQHIGAEAIVRGKGFIPITRAQLAWGSHHACRYLKKKVPSNKFDSANAIRRKKRNKRKKT